MPFDYLADFPLPAEELPRKLRELLTPVGLTRKTRVEVAARQDLGRDNGRREYLQMQMAVVPNDIKQPLRILSETGDGVVEFSVPWIQAEGGLRDFVPSISGYDYIVAVWGDNVFYTYQLAEKVWMALGLVARCVGGSKQRLVYDDLSLPEYGIAEGDISSEYEWRLKRDVVWTMTNGRLRDYLWMRGASAARVFFYEVLLPSTPGLRAAMGDKTHVLLKTDTGWCEVDLREHEDALLLQVWASVAAVSSERCQAVSSDDLVWPGLGPMTADKAGAIKHSEFVYLDDRFLERYEQDGAYDTVPVWVGREQWYCSPSYRNQWSFRECVRVARNLIRVPIRLVYEAKPDIEILHAHQFAVDPDVVRRMDFSAEHIVSKTQRLLDAYLDLADALVGLGQKLDLQETALDLTKISRIELRKNGWLSYPQLSRLAQVAPLSMSQQDFLSRCKSVHEFCQGIPKGFLKDLVQKSGVPRNKIRDIGTLKLLQCVLNIVQKLNAVGDRADAYASDVEPEGWGMANAGVAALFVANDLRIADAHEVGGRLTRLEALDFDLAEVNAGYGTALDRVYDSVIEGLALISREIGALQARSIN